MSKIPVDVTHRKLQKKTPQKTTHVCLRMMLRHFTENLCIIVFISIFNINIMVLIIDCIRGRGEKLNVFSEADEKIIVLETELPMRNRTT